MKPTSFINEHTVELVLVPELIRLLKPFFPKITPIYYWRSREGGQMSRESFQNMKVKILVLYARRPKVTFPGSPSIYIKFNQLLFTKTASFLANGIPVIVGFPLVNKIEDFSFGVKCIWRTINPEESEHTIEVSVDVGQNNLTEPPFISAASIAEKIGCATVYDWVTAVKKINEIRSYDMHHRPSFNFMGGDKYKPIYMIVHI